ncbi:MAG: hypothetical protein JWM40_1226 [Frankiales bacterium]|nr:hypothetical protein [Frankiales bacterium]
MDERAVALAGLTADTSPVLDGAPAYLSPLVSLVALGLIVLICRWVFSSGSRAVPTQRVPSEDLGLLDPVARVRTRADAEMLRDLLREAGVRAGISETTQGIQVLVFSKDLERARELVSAG